MKGKAVEAMRFGVPTVTSAAGAQGLAEALDFWRSPTTRLRSPAMLRLPDDDQEWVRASQAAQAFARARFSEDAQ